jgi:hypothetical protein
MFKQTTEPLNVEQLEYAGCIMLQKGRNNNTRYDM